MNKETSAPMKNYIGISRDHSGSMTMIARAAARDYNDNIAAIQEAATQNNQDTIISVVKCGSGRPAKVEREVINSNVHVLKPIAEGKYNTDGNSTPLFDSVGELIQLLEDVPDANDINVSFLVMVITDGQENSSKTWNGASIGKKIRELQATDRWTFVFRVPRGSARELSKLGIPEGNILEWDQTDHGVQIATQATRSAVGSYYSARALGKTSTDKFYADLSTVTLKEVKKSLVDISPEISIWPVTIKDNGSQIRDFVERHLPKNHAMSKGTAFYELTKTEAIQEYKQICIKDKKSNSVYSGPSARDLLGLPDYGEIKLAPGNHGNYTIFVQSTSVNRKLVSNSSLLYWPNAVVLK